MALFNPSQFSPAAPVIDVAFDLSSFAFWARVIFSLGIFPKIKNKTAITYASINTTSFIFYLEYLIALKVVSTRLQFNARVREYLQLTVAKRIPVIMQNIVNCIPTLPEYKSIQINIMGYTMSYDQNDALYNWAVGILNSPSLTPSSISRCLLDWSNPELYSGALTTFSVEASIGHEVGFVSVVNTTRMNTSVSKFGTQLPIDNLVLPRSTGSNVYTQQKASLSTGRPIGSITEIKMFNAINATPQLICAALLIGVNSINMQTIVQQSGDNTNELQFAIDDIKYAQFVFEFINTLPNPKVVMPTEFEDLSEDSSYDDDNGKSGSPGGATSIKVQLTKVRRAKTKKVSGVEVKFSNVKSLKPTLTRDELRAAQLSIGSALTNIEKTSNILQVDSYKLLAAVLSAWKNARDTINPKYGEPSD